MTKGISKNKNAEVLLDEWSKLKRDWFSVYNWKSLSRKGYSEEIAKILLANFEKVKINDDDLRSKKNFRVPNHLGQCQLSTTIEQHTEKRFCRALFNLKKEIGSYAK